jgi:fucose permease
VVGIFFYVGAEVCMGRFSGPTVMELIAPEFKGVTVGAKDKDKNPISLKKVDPDTDKTIEEWKDPEVLKKYTKTAYLAKMLGPTMFLLMLSIGRMGGGYILKFMSPRVSFRISALLGLLGAAVMMMDNKTMAIAGVVAAGLGFANIWPLLFSITVEEKPECANELSGLMCMAISGGALVPLLMGQLLDWHLGAYAFVVPAACFAYLLILSMKGGRAVAKT